MEKYTEYDTLVKMFLLKEFNEIENCEKFEIYYNSDICKSMKKLLVLIMPYLVETKIGDGAITIPAKDFCELSHIPYRVVGDYFTNLYLCQDLKKQGDILSVATHDDIVLTSHGRLCHGIKLNLNKSNDDDTVKDGTIKILISPITIAYIMHFIENDADLIAIYENAKKQKGLNEPLWS
ncbi:hypothetical protein [Ruminococcus sp.]|uniref:hypothetical protein n=1 Tax=Ruminococcus sp. TaxID=41978 RepID=UPI001B61F301|nr:hypothetical protein [Ruminococcus sp.]MBP5432140.1 hypothetical protein [Ruminococcus sp.]